MQYFNCPNCRCLVDEKVRICSNCSHSIENILEKVTREQVLLRDSEYQLTTARLIKGDRSYLLDGAPSLSIEEKLPNQRIPQRAMLFGLCGYVVVFVLSKSAGLTLKGLIYYSLFFVPGLLYFTMAKASYSLIARADGDEIVLYSSSNPTEVEKRKQSLLKAASPLKN